MFFWEIFNLKIIGRYVFQCEVPLDTYCADELLKEFICWLKVFMDSVFPDWNYKNNTLLTYLTSEREDIFSMK